MPPPPGGMPPEMGMGGPPPGMGPGGPGVPPPNQMPPMSGMQPTPPGGDANQALTGVVQMVMKLDQALMMLAQVFGETGAEEIAQVRQLLQAATAKFITSRSGGSEIAPTSSPTESGGPSFPGGL